MRVPGKIPIMVAKAYVGQRIAVGPDPKLRALNGTAGISLSVSRPRKP